MAEGHGWGGASRAGSNTPRWLPPALPLLVQGGGALSRTYVAVHSVYFPSPQRGEG